MKPWTAISRIPLTFLFCFISIFTVACDRSETKGQSGLGDQIELADFSQQEQAQSGKQDTPAVAKHDAPVIPAAQTNIEIAPGNIAVLALSAYDARAVVKSAQGDLQALMIGDVVPGTQATLVDILPDRLVFEEVITKPSGLKVKDTIWVYKAKNGVSRVQSLSRQAPQQNRSTVKKTTLLSE